MVNGNFVVNDQLSPEQIQLHPLVQHLLIVLSDKEKYIITNRFALEKNQRMTLEEIGQHFGVTRERIRQIEKGALRKLERNAQNTNIRILTEFAKALLEQEGAVAQDQYFKEKLMSILPNVSEQELQDLHLALMLDPQIHFTSNTLTHHPYWHLASFESSLVKKITSQAEKLLRAEKHVIKEDKLTEKINAALKTNLDEMTACNLLRISKQCKFTEQGVGLFSWRHIHPRTLRDKINFVLRREKKPLHFERISELIRNKDFDHKRVNIQAVHNELIRNEQFVLIGRGIYALEEWGYQTGTVADVIERLLEDGTPRTREEISKAVLDQRQVKTITIYLNLKNKAQFARVGRDKYTLTRFTN